MTKTNKQKPQRIGSSPFRGLRGSPGGSLGGFRALLSLLCVVLILASCNRNKFNYSASGTFEATEIIVSALTSGLVEEFDVIEGQTLTAGQYLGYVDTVQLYIQKLQLLAGVKSINARKPSVDQQVAVIKEQIAKAETEKKRVENLLKDGAATQKQYDDVDAQLKVLQRTLMAQTNQLTTSIDGLTGESDVREMQIAQVEDMLKKSRIINPIDGTVLNKYTQAYEVVAQGKPLFKIADTKNLFLRAYVVSTQLADIKVGQKAKVFVNNADGTQREYTGTVAWISEKAEFTPKTIQTKDERQNLVYAVKIAVENTDGLIKIGMYGDVNF